MSLDVPRQLLSENKTLTPPRLHKGTVILPLGESMVQVGTSPEHSFVLTNLLDEDEAWLRSLVPAAIGTAPAPLRVRRYRVSPPESPDSLRRRRFIVRRLEEAGLTEQQAAAPMDDLRIRVVGLDRVGIPLVRQLYYSGVRYVDVRDQRMIDKEVEYLFSPTDYGRPRLQVIKSELKRRQVFNSRLAMPNVVVTISSRVIDHHVAAILLNHDEVHLPIVVEDRSITVGPLLVPGMTCCYLCLDFHRRDEFPNWPQLIDILRQNPVPPQSPALSAAAASLTAHFIETLADTQTNREPELGSAWRVHATGVDNLHWDPHPLCRCNQARVLSP